MSTDSKDTPPKAPFFFKFPRPILFAFACAIGCAVGAAIGSLFVKPSGTETTTVESASVQQVVLLLDVSGSMSGQPLEEVKRAAANFVDRRDVNNRTRVAANSSATKDEMALLTFSDTAKVLVPMTSDANALKRAMPGLRTEGGTATDKGLQAAIDELKSSPGSVAQRGDQQVIVIFTDGDPDSDARQPSLQLAANARNLGVKIIAVGTGEATATFLRDLVNDPSDVYSSSSGDLGKTFDKVATKLVEYSNFMSSKKGLGTSSSAPVGRGSLTVGLSQLLIITSLMAIGLSIALVIANNLANGAKRTLIGPNELVMAIIVGVLAGVTGGVAGQLSYASLQRISETLSKSIGWMILGAVLGFSVRFFVPNVKWKRTLSGGTVGGLLASWAFVQMSSGSSETVSRLAGAGLLGLLIGLMIATALAIGSYAEAHLLVHHGTEVGRPMGLGAAPVKLGSSSNAHIYLRNAPPVAGEIVLADGDVVWHDLTKNSRTQLANGQRLKIGHIEIEVVAASKKT